jgi:hypothetical protein
MGRISALDERHDSLQRDKRDDRVVGDGDGDGKAFLLGCAVREREHLDTHCHAIPPGYAHQPDMAVGAVQYRISSWTEGSGTTMLQHGAEAGTGTFHQKQQ